MVFGQHGVCWFSWVWCRFMTQFVQIMHLFATHADGRCHTFPLNIFLRTCFWFSYLLSIFWQYGEDFIRIWEVVADDSTFRQPNDGHNFLWCSSDLGKYFDSSTQFGHWIESIYRLLSQCHKKWRRFYFSSNTKQTY